jgi:hypothetical protein
MFRHQARQNYCGSIPSAEIADGLRRLRSERTLWLTVIGISYFWFLGALVQINILFFGKELLHLDEFSSSALLGTTSSRVCIGIGSLAAGRPVGRSYRILAWCRSDQLPLGSMV